MTSEDHVDIWGVECDLEKAPRDGNDPTKKKDATMSWEVKRKSDSRALRDTGAGSGVDPERKKDLDAPWKLNRETQWNTWKNANSTRDAPCFGITRGHLNALRDRCRQKRRRIGRKNFRLNNVAMVRGVTPEELVLSQCDLEELPQVAEEIVKLPEMSFTKFEEALRRQEVVSIALIQAVEEVDLRTSSTLDTDVDGSKPASICGDMGVPEDKRFLRFDTGIRRHIPRRNSSSPSEGQGSEA
ncbi:hypothetical protein AC1031_011420 [Aphanomyces cochlioides]|nr:hypothetical protein AC1031_011420 [Aphanomyces cochlioides]